MDWKDVLYGLYVRVDRAKGLLMMGMLVVTNALQIAELVAWRGISPWISVPVVSVLIGIGILGFAVWWIDGLETYVNEQRANVALNPLQVYQLNPWQEMEFRVKRIPEIRALADLARERGLADRARELDESADRMEEWCRRGYVEKREMQEIAPHLLDHYLADEGERL